MRAKLLKINPDKLANELKKRGLTNSRVDTECGYTTGQVSRVMERGSISRQQAVTLKALYNINLEDYEEPEENPSKTEQVAISDVATIPSALQDAVYDAAVRTAKASTESVERVAKTLERIAAALERMEKAQEEPHVLTWPNIQNEEDDEEF